ncbi:VblB6 protein [Bartonella tribocorum]|uniref:Uncharacterized protein n=1 Tax=Bartonella tribocorum (strain DSM 28219 / CCUG 45778 / CIP 105476 / IBS 506) TaxID=382640 RepID=A9IYH0_BART1|nr:hypothetical protein [Bartonella tribocorum]CAK02360.1 hypothetical protein BT_2349 [Bartonella tribocorum CIP 105476]CDO49700.1 VblB6 protein [Bartonella tribocorum]
MAFENLHIFTTIDTNLVHSITKIMDKTISNLAASLATPLKASCTIYIAFMGYNIISGRYSIPL